MSPLRPAELIERKRNGERLADEEIAGLILGYARGEIPDYQLAAFCMAVYFRGLDAGETFALTDAMIRSGTTLRLGEALGRRVVDKHSTGGVGDKTSIAVGPIVAACGVPVGKMSGRGLGHTGGTLDKLEAIPGFDVSLSTDAFVAQIREVGLAIVGQTEDLVPADKQLYGLRDVTATVDIVPLIASSIMSKKIAGGADAIVLDVKVGDGAFMKTLEDARILAEAMLELGRRAGKEVVCLLTDMDQPLGGAVGNALEIAEARDTVRGEGPPDFTELVLDACARMLALSDLGVDLEEGRRRAEAAVADGSALDVYERWIRAQGGDPDPAALPAAPVVLDVRAPRAGRRRGGAPRARSGSRRAESRCRRAKGDEIDHAVGVVCRAKRGAAVAEGDVLAEVHARTDAAAGEAAAEVLAAFELGDAAPREHPILLDVVA
ncbi:MAG TPA: thymidine phosphorylase [Gaiellaceae bacterium]|nr:thymidine phosphorylase [Gaiellaceae bacterium]